jgi:hypothetical protein
MRPQPNISMWAGLILAYETGMPPLGDSCDMIAAQP